MTPYIRGQLMHHVDQLIPCGVLPMSVAIIRRFILDNRVQARAHSLVDDSITIEMPLGAHVLSVGAQGSHLVLWAIVTPEAKREKRFFSVFGTGHPARGIEDMRFIGTVQMGALVWHVFEETVL